MPDDDFISTYSYKVKSTGQSSDKYGPCEVCGTDCPEVFVQTEQRTIEFIAGGAIRRGLTYEGCRPHIFGHRECLVKIRREEFDPDDQRGVEKPQIGR